MLSGPNLDLSADIGMDFADLDGSFGKGISFDLDPDTGQQVITSAGPMYTTETKIGAGASVLPFPVDGGFQIGNSETESEIVYQTPWWPFR